MSARQSARERTSYAYADAAFLDTLTDDEVEAEVAHELGHVWIFTHHAYLQTEGLANQIAMRNRLLYVEHLDMPFGSVTFWGEARIVLGN